MADLVNIFFNWVFFIVGLIYFEKQKNRVALSNRVRCVCRPQVTKIQNAATFIWIITTVIIPVLRSWVNSVFVMCNVSKFASHDELSRSWKYCLEIQVHRIPELCLYTRKNAQLATNLQTNCYKPVHKLSTNCVHCLFPVVNMFGTTC